MKATSISFVSVFLLASLGWGSDQKLAPELKGRQSTNSVDVIVQYRITPAQKHRNKISAHGGLVKQHLKTIKGLVVTLPAWRAAELSNDPDVVYVSPDRPITRQMNNAAVGVLANYAWNLGLDGTGVAIAVIDSGVHGVDDLKDAQGKNRIIYNFDSLGGGSDDQYGHGRHPHHLRPDVRDLRGGRRGDPVPPGRGGLLTDDRDLQLMPAALDATAAGRRP